MIILYVLDGCPYCNNSLRVLKENKIKHKAIVVAPKDKEKYKKINKMNTFPQIFINADKDTYLKIGGNDDLEETIRIVKEVQSSNVSLDSIYYMYRLMNKSSRIVRK